MSENPPETEFDRLFDQFENELDAGKQPSIEELLKNFPSSLRERYCKEAISIEIHYLLQQEGEQVDLKKY